MSQIKRRLGFIGIGKCGCSITYLLHKYGYKCAFIDTNMSDLQYLDIPSHQKYHIPKAIGCGGDREQSKLFIERYYDDLVDFVGAALPSKDFYFIVTSQGGGTGSGETPILSHILSANDYKIGIISVIPSLSEDKNIQQNSLGFLKEMADNPSLAHFMYDNGKSSKLSINNCILHDMNTLFNIPETHSRIDSIDLADIISSLSYSGYAITTNFTSDTNSIKDSFYKAMKENLFPQPQYDRNIKQLLFSHGNVEDSNIVNEIIEEMSNMNIRKHENFCDRNSNHIVLLTGLSLPFNRIQQIKDAITHYEENTNQQQSHFEFNVDMEKESKEVNKGNKKVEQCDLSDIFAKYRK